MNDGAVKLADLDAVEAKLAELDAAIWLKREHFPIAPISVSQKQICLCSSRKQEKPLAELDVAKAKLSELDSSKYSPPTSANYYDGMID